MDVLKARTLLRLPRQSDWDALSDDERDEWVAYVRRRQRDVRKVAERIRDFADDNELTINQALYSAVLALAEMAL